MKSTDKKSSSKKEKEEIHSITPDPTKPDSEISYKKIHKIGDSVKKETK
ncbi:MAG: hypothetical protein ABI388_08450 [Bacteroidia bacterium]